MALSTIEGALEDLRTGRLIVVVDDVDGNDEGNLVIAAQKVTPAAINFMAREGRGLICVPLTGKRLEQLQLPLMVDDHQYRGDLAFTVSVAAKGRITSGASAQDRAATIRTLVDPDTRPQDLLRPGHTFPLRARDEGVLRHPGKAEAAIDLARLAGLEAAGVICEVMNEDGTIARRTDLEQFARQHDLNTVTIAQLISYRRRHEQLVRRVTEPVDLPTAIGAFKAIGYVDVTTGSEHLAIIRGPLSPSTATLVRVHSECLTGDVFGSQRCDCGEQLQRAMRMIDAEGGVIAYLRHHEGRGIGLHNKLRAYKLQEEGLDTVEANIRLGFPADLRDFGVGTEILRDLGLRRIRLMTNNPDKAHSLFGQSYAGEHGLELVETVPIQVEPNEHNIRYLETKRAKMGHHLEARDLLETQ